MKLFLKLIALMPIALFGGVIESPPVCDTPAVVKELKNIVKQETGKIVKDIIIVTKGSLIKTNGDHICGCSLSIDGTNYNQYVYGVLSHNKQLVRVEFIDEIQRKELKNPITINPWKRYGY